MTKYFHPDTKYLFPGIVCFVAQKEQPNNVFFYAIPSALALAVILFSLLRVGSWTQTIDVWSTFLVYSRIQHFFLFLPLFRINKQGIPASIRERCGGYLSKLLRSLPGQWWHHNISIASNFHNLSVVLQHLDTHVAIDRYILYLIINLLLMFKTMVTLIVNKSKSFLRIVKSPRPAPPPPFSPFPCLVDLFKFSFLSEKGCCWRYWFWSNWWS